MSRECKVCDGTGSLCPACGDSAHGCACRGVIIVDTCWACDGSGDAPTEAEQDAVAEAIMATRDKDALAGRFNKPKRE